MTPITFDDLLSRMDGKTPIVIYIGHDLGQKSFVAKATGTHLKVDHDLRTVWLRDFTRHKSRIPSQSLHDMGIIPQTYNNHKSFWTEDEANEYINAIISKAEGK